MSIERVREYFQRCGMAERVLEFPVSSATVELAAAALGVHTVFHINFHFHGRIAAGVHDLTADDVNDFEKLFHGNLLL